MDKITRQLSEYASRIVFDDIDQRSIHAAVQRLVDSVGCAIGGYGCEETEIGRNVVRGQRAGNYAGRVLFDGDLLPAESASYVNTTMIRKLDFNDRYPGGHPSDCLGALLALAGARPTSGQAFITAMIVTYEIFARLSDSAKLSRRGWDQGYAISISTAAGICNLLGLSLEQTANAIGIAAVSNIPLRVTRSGELTPWKNAATAYAVRNGVFAALLAAEGMAGPGSPFEGRNGLFENITGKFELSPFPNSGGEPLTPQVQIKYWPVETNGQPVVWAALDLRKSLKPANVTEIEVFTSKFTWFEIGSEPEKWDPNSRETADHSLPYIFARTFVDGPLTQDSFSDSAVLDPTLRPLMSKIKVTVDEEIERVLAEKVVLRARAASTDGTVHETEVINPLGHPGNPMMDDDINEKFTRLATPVFGEERAAQVLERLWNATDTQDVSVLFDAIELMPEKA